MAFTAFYGLPENGRGVAFLSAEVVLWVLACTSTGLRLWARRLQKVQLRINDWLILISLALLTGRIGLEITMVLKCGLGLHVGQVVSVQPDLPFVMQELLWITDLIWVTLVTLIKLSILHFYTMVFRQPSFIRIVYAAMALCIVFWIAAFPVTAMFCLPPQKLWNPELPGRCIDSHKYYVASASTDIIVDVIVIVLPMPVLWGLQLPRFKRIALMAVFGLGFVIIAITFIRIKFMLEFDPTDATYTTLVPILLSTTLPSLGIVNANLPLLAPVLKRINHNISTTFSSHKSSRGTRDDNDASSHRFERLGEPMVPLEPLKAQSLAAAPPAHIEATCFQAEKGAQRHTSSGIEPVRILMRVMYIIESSYSG